MTQDKGFWKWLGNSFMGIVKHLPGAMVDTVRNSSVITEWIIGLASLLFTPIIIILFKLLFFSWLSFLLVVGWILYSALLMLHSHYRVEYKEGRGNYRRSENEQVAQH